MPASKADSAKMRPPLPDPSELEALRREVDELRRTGKTETQIEAHVERALQEMTGRLDKALTGEGAGRATSNVSSSRRPFLQRSLSVVAAGGGLWVVTGCLVWIGGRLFVFSSTLDRYFDYWPWIAPGLLALSVWLLFRIGMDRQLSGSIPTKWLRQWIVLPAAAALCATMLTASLLGWIALHCQWFGARVDDVELRVLSIGATSSARGCQRYARIAFDGGDAQLCLTGLWAATGPDAGRTLVARGRISDFGMSIEALRSK